MELNLTRPFIVFDLETTGVTVASDRIIEISMLKILPDGQTEWLTEQVKPLIAISDEAFNVHGISYESLKDKPTFADRAQVYAKFIGNADLSGYNAIKFDIPLLVEEFLRVGIDFDIKGRKMVDMQNIFHKMEPRTLSAAYKFYCGKKLENAHSAQADTMATYEVLKAQLDRYQDAEYEDRDGNISKPVVNDISALSEFSYHKKSADLLGQLVFNEKDEEIFNFGKYKGQKVSAVFAREPQYYDWMMKSQFPLSTKKVITAIYLRGFNNASVNLK